MPESLENIKIQHLTDLSLPGVTVDILRLDLLHPVVSGNKWFKLRYHISEALENGSGSIATFGGAWSNHIVATAYAAAEAGIPSLGLIRGDESAPPSPALLDARQYGMELVFVTREDYRNKEELKKRFDEPGTHWIMEGGYGPTGAKGAGEILTRFETSRYTHILCAVGTGTMMAGLVNAAGSHQLIEGISVLKGHTGLENEVGNLVNDPNARFIIHQDYHFGGYGKHPEGLLDFMRECWVKQRLPTDIVYTSKLVYATKDLLLKGYFPSGSRLLLIHSGGLQGNRSLPAGKLPF